MAEPTAVYRLYDSADRLLYVGVSVQPRERWLHHARWKAWWRDVIRREIEWHPDRETALAAEKAAIKAERPLHNVTDGYHPPQRRTEREPRDYDNSGRLRIANAVWAQYGTIVGDLGRSDDLRSYMEWRIENPDTPLPGKRLGPIRKVRQTRATESQ